MSWLCVTILIQICDLRKCVPRLRFNENVDMNFQFTLRFAMFILTWLVKFSTQLNLQLNLWTYNFTSLVFRGWDCYSKDTTSFSWKHLKFQRWKPFFENHIFVQRYQLKNFMLRDKVWQQNIYVIEKQEGGTCQICKGG